MAGFARGSRRAHGGRGTTAPVRRAVRTSSGPVDEAPATIRTTLRTAVPRVRRAAPASRPGARRVPRHTVRSGDDRRYGEFLVLRAGGFDHWYCHLSEKTVERGSVKAGQKTGEVGSRGNATGSHLHFGKRPADGRFGSDVTPGR